ncbi:hypothetical protein V6N13_143347 [Hibiscus sabdariffa]
MCLGKVGNRESRGPVAAKVTDRRGQLQIWEQGEEALTARRNRVQEAALVVENSGKNPIVVSKPNKSSKKKQFAALPKIGESSKAQDGEQAMVVEMTGNNAESLPQAQKQITPAMSAKDHLITMPCVLDPKDHSTVKIISKDLNMGREKEHRRTAISTADYGFGRTELRLSRIKSGARSNLYGLGKSNSGSIEHSNPNPLNSVVVSDWIQTLAQKLDEAGKGDENPLRELELQEDSVTEIESNAVVVVVDGGIRSL